MKNTIKSFSRQNSGSYYRLTFTDDTSINYFINKDENRRQFIEHLKTGDQIEYEPISTNNKFPPYSEQIKLLEQAKPETQPPSKDNKDTQIARMNALTNSVQLHAQWLQTKQIKEVTLESVKKTTNDLKNYIETGK